MLKGLSIIKAESKKTEFSNSEHLTITVNGRGLDQIINDYYPYQNYLGLVPTLLDWLENEEERKIVWGRIEKQEEVVPLLMCPDDCDLRCSVIVVDSFLIDDKVTWKRIGVDCTNNQGFTPDKIGQNVLWLDKIKPMTFSLDNYRECIETFRTSLTPKKFR